MLNAHPLSEVFGMMPEPEYRKLKASIAEYGQQQPVTLYQGKILDGRNRARACAELGLELATQELNGQIDPLQYVLVHNLERRHLDKSQLAMVAARLATLGHGGDRSKVPIGTLITIEQSSEKCNVAVRSTKRARKVIERQHESLIKAVDSGAVAVSDAASWVQRNFNSSDITRILLTTDKKSRKALIKKAAARAKAKRERQALKLKSQHEPVPKKLYSLDAWKELTPAQRKQIIDAGLEAESDRMNAQQDSDSIEWAKWSLNTVTGCLHDCPYCYARDIAERLYPQGFAPTFIPSRLGAPRRQAVPDEADKDISYKNVFANSMSDLFGQWVPAEWIQATIDMAKANPQWNFLTLTKFPQRACKFSYPDNWWLGTTVDAQARVVNAEKAFERLECGTKWLSVEPLLEPLTFKRLDLFQWIVIGGSSKSSKTPAWIPNLDWLAELHAAARAAGCSIYYKSNSGLEGQLRLREFPWSRPAKRKLPTPFKYLKGM